MTATIEILSDLRLELREGRNIASMSDGNGHYIHRGHVVVSAGLGDVPHGTYGIVCDIFDPTTNEKPICVHWLIPGIMNIGHVGFSDLEFRPPEY